jgi:hypothetical protein
MPGLQVGDEIGSVFNVHFAVYSKQAGNQPFLGCPEEKNFDDVPKAPEGHRRQH